MPQCGPPQCFAATISWFSLEASTYDLDLKIELCFHRWARLDIFYIMKILGRPSIDPLNLIVLKTVQLNLLLAWTNPELYNNKQYE